MAGQDFILPQHAKDTLTLSPNCHPELVSGSVSMEVVFEILDSVKYQNLLTLSKLKQFVTKSYNFLNYFNTLYINVFIIIDTFDVL